MRRRARAIPVTHFPLGNRELSWPPRKDLRQFGGTEQHQGTDQELSHTGRGTCLRGSAPDQGLLRVSVVHVPNTVCEPRRLIPKRTRLVTRNWASLP